MRKLTLFECIEIRCKYKYNIYIKYYQPLASKLGEKRQRNSEPQIDIKNSYEIWTKLLLFNDWLNNIIKEKLDYPNANLIANKFKERHLSCMYVIV